MDTQSVDPRILLCGEIVYGKPVRSKHGPLQENASYGINSVTSSVDNPLQFIPVKFLDNANLVSKMIDPEYARRGALIVKAVEDGLAVMRLRYRAEAGEGEGGRHFLLSHTLLIPGINYWNEVPVGLFSWCERNLEAIPFVQGEDTVTTSREINLPGYQPRDVDWYDKLSEKRQIQLGSAFQAIREQVGWIVSAKTTKDEKSQLASIITADLDVIASLPSKFPLRNNNRDRFILNLGLDPKLTPGAISYFPGYSESAVERPDLDALRVAIFSSDKKEKPDQGDQPGERFLDNLDRRIGSDPIPLKLNRKKISS